jgi:hypothetical protein
MNCGYNSARRYLRAITRHSPHEGCREAVDLLTEGDVAKFVFASDMPINDAFQFGIDLVRHGLLRLPFPQCYFERGDQCFFVREDEVDEASGGFIWTVWGLDRRGLDGEPIVALQILLLGVGMLANAGPDAKQARWLRRPPWVDITDEQTELLGFYYMDMLSACIGFLGFRHATQERVTVAKSVQARRTRQGKEPLPEYTVVRIDGAALRRDVGAGAHASPRPHWRRGHVRTLPSGSKTVVRPHPVMGEPAALKTYMVKP